MRDRTAIELAVDLLHMPSRARGLRAVELPSGLKSLLEIVAGEKSVIDVASKAVGLPAATVRSASAFFIEQVLFHPDADSYRVLGSRHDATSEELRQHVALLLRWLHPDIDQHNERSVFVGRVTGAWNDLKTAERRAKYDSNRAQTRALEAERRAQNKIRRQVTQLDHGVRSRANVQAQTAPAFVTRATTERGPGWFTRVLRRIRNGVDA